MLYVHATTLDHLASIRSGGLQVRHHRLRRPAIWLVSQHMGPWAAAHAMHRHRIGPQDVALVYVELPRSWVRRCRYAGQWWCPRDVPAECIRRVETFAVRVLEG
jgi:hypothetical protein